MEILNLKRIEKISAVLWDGEEDTLYYLNNDFLSAIKELYKNEDFTQDYYSILKFEKTKDSDLLLTFQYYFSKDETHLKIFKLDEYVILKITESPICECSIEKVQKNELSIMYEIANKPNIDYSNVEDDLNHALENEDYILAAKLRDILNKKSD